ncbi:hypothetical protein IWQ61_005949 [Dispira simplex]|nr:hypothetical protein IWQ61_005949 [Dispira simplex]
MANSSPTDHSFNPSSPASSGQTRERSVPKIGLVNRTRKNVFSSSILGRPLDPHKTVREMTLAELEERYAVNAKILQDTRPDGGKGVRENQRAVMARLHALKRQPTRPISSADVEQLGATMDELSLSTPLSPNRPSGTSCQTAIPPQSPPFTNNPRAKYLGKKPARVQIMSMDESLELQKEHYQKMQMIKLEADLQRQAIDFMARLAQQEEFASDDDSQQSDTQDNGDDHSEISDGEYDRQRQFLDAEAEAIRRTMEPGGSK